MNSLTEFEGGDDFVRELNGDVREFLWLYADDVCAIDLKVTSWLPSGTNHEREEAYEKEPTQNLSLQMLYKRR